MTDEIAREGGDAGGRYVLVRDGVEAELTYRIVAPDRWIADHTGVPERIGGQGIGQALIARMVADARAEGATVEPRCPFVAAMARRHPDWQDVISARR